METNINIDNKKVQKCLKSYLTGKKYYDTDLDKSFEYFKQCITLLGDIKTKNIDNLELNSIMEETETECSKYLTMAIETTIEQPIIKHKTNNNKELFEIIETGTIERLKQYKYGMIQFTEFNENGLTPLHVAIRFGDTNFLKQAFRLGALIDTVNKAGHTLLEFACLEKDPNLINFLILYGADMRKHLMFRDGKKYHSNCNSIDIMLLCKMILDFENMNKPNKNIIYLDFLFKYFPKNDIIDIMYYNPSKNITFEEFIIKLDNMIVSFPKDNRDTFITIIREELDYDLHFKLGCPSNKLEILLYNLVPFIEYDNLKLTWIHSIEIKYLILKILRNKVKINTKQLKIELREILYNMYIKDNIATDGMIQTLVLQWINKIKV